MPRHREVGCPSWLSFISLAEADSHTICNLLNAFRVTVKLRELVLQKLSWSRLTLAGSKLYENLTAAIALNCRVKVYGTTTPEKSL